MSIAQINRAALLLALCSVPAFAQDDLKTSADRGKVVYGQTCFACHQPSGLGAPGVFPPLTKSEYASGDARRAVAIVIKGVTGPLDVKGMKYGIVPMPPPDVTYPMLKDDKNVADVLNYVRTTFGNEAKEAITPALVAEVRKEFADRKDPWTEAELKNFPAKK